MEIIIKMNLQLYELIWELVTDIGTFGYREFKVFGSAKDVRRYGRKREQDLNNGLPIKERAHDGYYYKYCGAVTVEQIDGYRISLVKGVR